MKSNFALIIPMSIVGLIFLAAYFMHNNNKIKQQSAANFYISIGGIISNYEHKGRGLEDYKLKSGIVVIGDFYSINDYKQGKSINDSFFKPKNQKKIFLFKYDSLKKRYALYDELHYYTIIIDSPAGASL
ncbi:MAG: hypothetical protein ACK567_14765 [Chitinophagales bacterium]|jgi:hypothetical protein|nr:hypothetical protein [Sphingobacteriales bacterium]